MSIPRYCALSPTTVSRPHDEVLAPLGEGLPDRPNNLLILSVNTGFHGALRTPGASKSYSIGRKRIVSCWLRRGAEYCPFSER
jgi:hypothetical protein